MMAVVLGQSEGVHQTSINLLQDVGREPSEAADNLVPRHRGEGLAINDAVEPEVGLSPCRAAFRHKHLAREILV